MYAFYVGTDDDALQLMNVNALNKKIYEDDSKHPQYVTVTKYPKNKKWYIDNERQRDVGAYIIVPKGTIIRDMKI